MPVPVPSHLTVGDVIGRLEQEPDPCRVVPVGFGGPHWYRGDYTEAAFGIRTHVTIGSMLDAARPAPGATFEGWSGGEHTMHGYDGVRLVREEGDNGETLGSVLLSLLPGQGKS
jgi:hypothetical protein